MEGVKLSLESKIEKLSPLDNSNHLYQSTSKFNKLPPYLMVQMIRFFWKAADDLPNAKPVAVKICKSIDFGTKLDLYEYCTPELKEKLEKGR
jgi:ubiquitin carboxyl-terminal hydrolase 14